MMKHKKIVRTITLATLLAMSMEQVKAMDAAGAPTHEIQSDRSPAPIDPETHSNLPPAEVLAVQAGDSHPTDANIINNQGVVLAKQDAPPREATAESFNQPTTENESLSLGTSTPNLNPSFFQSASNAVNNFASKTIGSGSTKHTSTDSAGNTRVETRAKPAPGETQGALLSAKITAADGSYVIQDGSGKITSSVDVAADPSSIIGGKLTTMTTYDAQENPHSAIITDNMNNVKIKTFGNDGSYTIVDQNGQPVESRTVTTDANNNVTTETTNGKGQVTERTVVDSNGKKTTTTTFNNDGSRTIVTTDTTNPDLPTTKTVEFDKNDLEVSPTLEDSQAVVKAQQDLQASRSKNSKVTQTDVYTKSDAAFAKQDALLKQQQAKLEISKNKVLISDMLQGQELATTRVTLITAIGKLNKNLDSLTDDDATNQKALKDAQDSLKDAQDSLTNAQKALTEAQKGADPKVIIQAKAVVATAKIDVTDAQNKIKTAKDIITKNKADIKAKTADLAKQSDLLSKTNDQLTTLQNKMLTSKPSSFAIFTDRLSNAAARKCINAIDKFTKILQLSTIPSDAAENAVTDLLNAAKDIDSSPNKTNSQIFLTNIKIALNNPSPLWNVDTLTKVEKVFTQQTNLSKITKSGAEKSTITLPLAKDATWLSVLTLSSSAPKLPIPQTSAVTTTGV